MKYILLLAFSFLPLKLTPQNVTVSSHDLNGIKMMFVEGGSYNMGSNTYDGEKPIHTVTVRSFYMSIHEITQQQWQSIMGENPSLYGGCDDCPVERVSWNDIQVFLSKLNAKYREHFRLPTEAEWEFAARGGLKSKGYLYSGSNELGEVAWYTDTRRRNRPERVGLKKPNELGIYDLSGNVQEWCDDWFTENYAPSGVNTKGRTYKVIRGGGFANVSSVCRVSDRSVTNTSPDEAISLTGFRIVLSYNGK